MFLYVRINAEVCVCPYVKHVLLIELQGDGENSSLGNESICILDKIFPDRLFCWQETWRGESNIHQDKVNIYYFDLST
ncbi:MAG: hypothetical protein A3E60_02545 [Candidatus Kerfeldbacteria bacterium RIFCSPHIGHO2_12_FULL_42_13]|nr:MAG: hypothetical protein A3E60_02545 [Candidatus Kerfeldbacteria bacterium RIFCSPHIGHO2_12_FULL_42_13]